MSVVTDLAKALANDLKEEFSSNDCTVLLTLVPRSNITDTHGKTVIMVCPRKLETDEDVRGVGAFFRISVDVGIMRQITTDNDSVAAMCDVVENVLAFIRKRKLEGFPAAKWVSAANKPIYDAEKILTSSLFFSVVSSEYVLRGR